MRSPDDLRTLESVNGSIDALLEQGRFAEADLACVSLPEELAREIRVRIDASRKLPNHGDMRPDAYHRWYYDKLVWKHRSWCGIPILKSPLDLWNYQEIIAELRPDLIIEFGSFKGGSALFFAHLQRMLGIDGRVVSVDISLAEVTLSKAQREGIEFIEADSTAPFVRERLHALRRDGRAAFAILDSDHAHTHVYRELLSLREVLRPGDYLIVEDGNINGHPVLPEWGEGPYEAIARYMREFPDDYTHDYERERAFGWTFAPEGFLIRR